MIGIIPAAGTAERFGGLTKFLLPCTGDELLITRLHRLMHKVFVNFDTEFFLHPDNADLFKRLCNPRNVRAVKTNTMTETVLNACSYSEPVLFGMPDTYFEDEQAFVKLAAALDDGGNRPGADVVLGVFRARHDQYSQGGMCKLDGDVVYNVMDKMAEPRIGYDWIWGLMAWKPVFWDFLKPDMPHVGYGIMPAVHAGLDVRAVKLDGNYYDCGTPERYFEMIRATTGEAVNV